MVTGIRFYEGLWDKTYDKCPFLSAEYNLQKQKLYDAVNFFLTIDIAKFYKKNYFNEKQTLCLFHLCQSNTF